MGLNDTAWENLFAKYNILDEINQNGKFIISARQIKEFREPRLMTKFDHKVNLPVIFSENNLSILPITRGEYRVENILYHRFLHTKNLGNHLMRFREFLFHRISKALCHNLW